MVNDRLRADAIRTANSSLEYLDKELAKTSVVEIRQAIYRLTEEQVSNAMLANVQREYAFHFIDPAVPPETKFSPKRTVMTGVGAAIGLFLGMLIVYVRREWRTRR
jgi:LPS O-antigen subunit length determinant protein (WzzB/FepE family)